MMRGLQKGENVKTLVPRVLRQTTTSREKKNVNRGDSRQWDKAASFDDIRERRGEQEMAIARRLLQWAHEHGLSVSWGQGKEDGSFLPMYGNKFGKNFLFSVWTYGSVELQFQHMRTRSFGEEGKRRDLVHRLPAIGLPIAEEALKRRPAFGLSLLKEPAAVAKFLEAFDWMLPEIRKPENVGTPVS